MQTRDKKKSKSRCLSSALIAKLDTGVMLNCQALRDQHERLTAPDGLSEFSQYELSCSEEAGENYYTGN